jgi:hypothetical protein
MKYVPPYGIADPDANYINGDPSIARQGSIPPAEAFEHPMRELVAIIQNSVITPDAGDLEQVAKGIRSQRMNYAQDTGSVNTLSVAYDPPIASYTIGLPLHVKIANTNTGPSTIDAGGGRVSIKKPTGAEMANGDLPAGGLAHLIYDGTNFQMVNFGGAGGGIGDTFIVNIPYTVDTGTVNTVIANFSPAITALVPGTIIMVKIANTNTSFANINVNGLGLKAIYAQGGSPNWPLLPSDLVAGDVLVFVYDGTRFWIYANTILNQNITFTVSSNTAFNELFVALGRKRILANVTVTIMLATGIYTPLKTEHPNADRINVQGTMLAALPSFGDFYHTGPGSAQRATDSANNIAMLRSRYGTEVQISNTSLLIPGLQHIGGGQITFTNILVTGSNVYVGAGRDAIVGVAPGFGAALNCVGVTVWGTGSFGFMAAGGDVFCTNCFAANNWTSGFLTRSGGRLTIQACGVYGNAETGVECGQAQALLTSRIGVPGLSEIPGCQIMANGQNGLKAQVLASITTTNGTTITGNTNDIYAGYMSMVHLSSSTFGTTTPPTFVVGNNNSIISYS